MKLKQIAENENFQSICTAETMPPGCVRSDRRGAAYSICTVTNTSTSFIWEIIDYEMISINSYMYTARDDNQKCYVVKSNLIIKFS